MAASAIDAGIQKKTHGSGVAALVISNDELNNIIKIVQAFEHSNILLRGATKTIQNEAKEQKGWLLNMLLGTLGAGLLGNMLSGKEMLRAGYAHGKGMLRAGNGVFSRDTLPNKIKNVAYGTNLDEYADVGTHWTALFCTEIEVIYFGSFGVEHIPKEIKKFILNKSIKANIFRIQSNNSIMWGYFCIVFMFANKKLTDFTSLFSPYDFEKMTA